MVLDPAILLHQPWLIAYEDQTMECAECGRSVAPGTQAFVSRVIVETKSGEKVLLCGSCGSETSPILRRWAIMEGSEGLASMSTTVRPHGR
jgi:NMD protein affecting ribosome stability and mRNA decay